ncbi:hypothetical protein ACFQY7_18110 [Actinomadura luteofluorescens]|uniref:hypothetical protein n=1 Tax=Actinomadura luteofluorescens TaxID=46163 RepID=UPI003628F342
MRLVDPGAAVGCAELLVDLGGQFELRGLPVGAAARLGRRYAVVLGDLLDEGVLGLLLDLGLGPVVRGGGGGRAAVIGGAGDAGAAIEAVVRAAAAATAAATLLRLGRTIGGASFADGGGRGIRPRRPLCNVKLHCKM